MKERHLTGEILEALSDTPVVFIQGPRQSGKTTLVQNMALKGRKYEYFTMDDAAVLSAAETDPNGFVEGLPENVILDEIQRVPNIFLAIKRSVDLKRKPGRFLLTGSANALLLPKASESLAGRMQVLRLWPFSQGEIEGNQEHFIDDCFAKEFKQKSSIPSGWASLVHRIVMGGYPEILTRKDENRRRAWFGSYVTTILERDIRDIANIQGLRELPRFLKLVAARTSGLLNLSDLSRDAGISLTTMQRYWALLEAVFFAQTLRAWSGNLTSRLVKSPKLLLEDTGLLCYLLGLDEDRLKSDDLMTGAVLESFVAGELIKQMTWSKTRPTLFHYRTHTQQEVDLVLEDAAGRLVGIEVKKTSTPSGSDFKGLRHLKEQTGKKFHRGILLYTGSTSVAFGESLYAVPVGALWAK